MDDHPAPAILRLADGAVLVIEQLPDGQLQRTRIEPNGTTSVEVVQSAAPASRPRSPGAQHG